MSIEMLESQKKFSCSRI